MYNISEMNLYNNIFVKDYYEGFLYLLYIV